MRSYLPADHPLKHAEIGSEPDPATFLDTLLALTAEWGRVLAPWGSIAIELGDTYAGSGGAGGDYNAGGLRDGQGKFDGSANRGGKNGRHSMVDGATGGHHMGGDGWPLAKSLALIPQLYAASLAYGRNLLTGRGSPAGRWRVRNVIVWHRPNPAVGALGDKVRPSTSYIVVATRSDKRWFDLTAVRSAYDGPPPVGGSASSRQASGDVRGRGGQGAVSGPVSNPAGAPPLDCWFDTWDGSHDTWTVTTQPSRIKIETGEFELIECGPDDGGERTTSPDCPVHGDRPGPVPTEQCDEHVGASSPHTQCIDDRREPAPTSAGSRGELTSSRSGQPTATRHSKASSRTGHAPSTNQPGTPSAETVDDIAHTSTSPESCGSHPCTCENSTCGACRPAGEPETALRIAGTSDQESACTCSFHIMKPIIHSHYAMWPAKLAERLILSMCPAEVCVACGTPRRRVEATGGLGRGRTSRNYDAQIHLGEANKQGRFRPPDVATRTPLGWTDCGCGSGWTPGVTLDPFAGTGTTLAVADLHGRDAIGIDLDPRNRDLYPARYDEVKRSLFGTRPELPGQLGMFGGDA